MKKTVEIGHQDFAEIKQENGHMRLRSQGVCDGNIRSYGFAFCGKQVLIDRG